MSEKIGRSHYNVTMSSSERDDILSILRERESNYTSYSSIYKKEIAQVDRALTVINRSAEGPRDYKSISIDTRMINSQLSQRRLLVKSVVLGSLALLASLVFITLGIFPLTFMVGALCSAAAVGASSFMLIKGQPVHSLQHSLDLLELEQTKALQKELEGLGM